MGYWTSNNPCKNCGKKGGPMLRCPNCGTLGCPPCVGPSGGPTYCKVCKKSTRKVKV